jgi:DNA repair protein RecO (recombination protein O)
VSRDAGEPYRDKLLALPPFLRGRTSAGTTPEDVAAGFALTGHFFEARVLEPRDLTMPQPRQRMLDVLAAGRKAPL